MAEFDVEERARLSAGESAEVIHDAVLAALMERIVRARCLLDVGCGTGRLRIRVQGVCERYIGADAIRHSGFPAGAEFVLANLDTGRVALPDGACDVVACIETIEHVENPRALMRELVRLTSPGGWLVVTTPNQLSVLSKLTLLSKNEFVHFQERPGLYPAHISALLEVDLVRMCRENGLEDVAVRYSGRGRVPFTPRDWPSPLRASSGAKGRAFSDNVLVVARKPLTGPSATNTR
jgi:2-polyprenyl-3-methyl-5-hydroxy-6-metoxy-1,4-benzoquinol methylase